MKLLEPVREVLSQHFPDVIPRQGEIPADGPLVPIATHVGYARCLKEKLGYTLYVSVIATHFPGETGDRFEVATVLRNPTTGDATWWRVQLTGDQEIPTLYDLFAGADWQEREQFDLVGVRFRDHPDLRRLMLPEDWVGHPLRKEYAIDTACAPWR